jgi:hypothetical protein
VPAREQIGTGVLQVIIVSNLWLCWVFSI